MQKYQGQELRTQGDLFQDFVYCREDKGFHNGIAGLVGVKADFYPGLPGERHVFATGEELRLFFLPDSGKIVRIVCIIQNLFIFLR